MFINFSKDFKLRLWCLAFSYSIYHVGKLFGRNFALEVQSSASNAPGLREAGMPKESIGWVELEPGKSLETEVTVSVSEITG